MNRRNFLQSAIALLVAEAAPKVIPFGRVWSFPKEIVVKKLFEWDEFLLPHPYMELRYMHPSQLSAYEELLPPVVRPLAHDVKFYEQVLIYRPSGAILPLEVAQLAQNPHSTS